MDWLADKGGSGAIDLVMHVRDVEFKDAVRWLSGQDLTTLPTHSRQTFPPKEEYVEPRPLDMPTPNEKRWIAVKDYLVDTRGLPSVLVDRLHEKGLIFADDHQNAVFVRYQLQENTWKRGQATGASLRGTWGERNSYHRLVPGSVRERGWFWIGTGHGAVNHVFLTESPIDAMSLAVLDRERQNRHGVTFYLSTDGTGGIPVEALQSILDRNGQVIAAFDADTAGESMAWRIAEQLPGIRRLKPAYGKDWNERLIHRRQPEQARQTNLDKTQLRRLWQWHQVARLLRRSDNYLSRITEVARNVAKGEPLSEQAQAAMQQDLATAQQRLNRLPQGQSQEGAVKKSRSPAVELEE
ncbi:MAG: DUF3991 domain-containing protein [Leptolyngbya sp. SIO4C1]|nr:DUF3991 domain-containing protein [Leptolyngbya sp. SIO4C1]